MITTDKEMARKITDLMHDCGIPANLRGHRYIRTAVMLAINDETAAERGSMTELYTAVSELCNSNPGTVERSTRYAIHTAWGIGNIDTQNRLFGYTVNADSAQPSNSCFISTLADAIRMEVTA